MPSQNVGKYASKPKPKPKPRSKPSAKMAPPKPADKPPKPELPPKERPPREYQKGVQRQAFLTKDANEYNKNPDGKKLQQNWPPMSSTIPAEPDRTNLRAIPYRDWWVAFLLLVCAWFIMAHGDGAAIEKLSKETEQLRKDKRYMDFFITAFDLWFHNNNDNLMGLLSKFDVNNSGTIEYSAFKSALFDLDAPCNRVEAHLICRILDSDCTGKVEYDLLENRLINIIYNETNKPDPNDRIPIISDKPDAKIKRPKKSKKKGKHRKRKAGKVKVKHVAVPVELREHVVSNSDDDIKSLVKWKDNCYTENQPKSSECEDGSLLPLGTSLQQKNFEGGTRNHPLPLMMFYTYFTEFTKCPLLLCDHYMTVQKASKEKTSDKDISSQGRYFTSRRR